MTKQELIALLSTDIIPKAQAGKDAYDNLIQLANKVLYGVTNSAISASLTQTNIDNIVTTYTPQYSALLAAIEVCGDALGTDIFTAQAANGEPGVGNDS